MSHIRIMTIVFLLTGVLNICGAQEFKEYPNGLIYNDTTMHQLRFIVDSMNLKYKKCDPSKNYYSIPQARANYISLDTGKILAAKHDIENNISLTEFRKKYPLAHIENKLLLVKDKSKDYDDKWGITFSSVELTDNSKSYIHSSDTSLNHKKLTGKWIMEYAPKSEYSARRLEAFYITEDFKTSIIPDKYARMIQYVDCMIDTNTSIFLKRAKESYHRAWKGEGESAPKTPKLSNLKAYIDKNTNRPDKKQYKTDSVFWSVNYKWMLTKDSVIDVRLAKKPEFRTMLKEAIAEAIKSGNGDEDLETLAEKYDTKAHTLQLKRSRIVVGGCSQDSRPRIHALQIAELAAETVNWDIFLRAHLDIMNDRFSRVSDGSYAYARRKTYIRELELLDFDVTTLIMGITLRIDNPSGEHYFGSIGRLGRALSESEHATEIEQLMAGTIKDNSLDNFNRIIVFYLYRNYIYYLTDKDRKKENIFRLRNAVAALPSYLSSRITIMDSDFGNR